MVVPISGKILQKGCHARVNDEATSKAEGVDDVGLVLDRMDEQDEAKIVSKGDLTIVSASGVWDLEDYEHLIDGLKRSR